MEQYKTLQELFKDKRRWIKGVSSIDKDGYDSFGGPESVKWCLLGGVYKVYTGTERDEVFRKVRVYIDNKFRVPGISAFNDAKTTTIHDIRKLVRELNI